MEPALLKKHELTIPEVIQKIENGLPVSAFNTIRDELGLSDKQLSQAIRIPKSTLAVRKKRGRFSFEESERLYRVQRLIGKAVDVLGDIEMARKWLKDKAYGLGDVSPLDYSKTEVGAREVENLLGRLEHGVYS